MDRIRSCGVWAVAVVWSAIGAAAEQPSIADQVNQHGSFERMLVRTDKFPKLADLVGGADLIVEASAQPGTAFVDKSGMHIYTDYRATLDAIHQNRHAPGLIRPGQEIVVRREIGTVMLDGRPAISAESDFPPFEPGTSYVLFLKHSAKEKVYTVVAGPLGAFRSGEEVVPVAGAPGTQVAWPASSRDAFLGELSALLRFSN